MGNGGFTFQGPRRVRQGTPLIFHRLHLIRRLQWLHQSFLLLLHTPFPLPQNPTSKNNVYMYENMWRIVFSIAGYRRNDEEDQISPFVTIPLSQCLLPLTVLLVFSRKVVSWKHIEVLVYRRHFLLPLHLERRYPIYIFFLN